MFKQIYTTEMSGSKKVIEKRFEAINRKKKSRIIIVVSVLSAIIIVCGAVLINGYVSDSAEIYGENETAAAVTVNPYNEKYIDTSGITIAQVAEEAGITLEEFLAEYELPADMPADTSRNAAYQMIPCKKIAEIYGLSSFEELKEKINFPDFVTGNTPWGEALDETTLRDYIGDGETLENFKEYYGFGDEVTADTKYKEVRQAVSERTRQERWDAVMKGGMVTNAVDDDVYHEFQGTHTVSESVSSKKTIGDYAEEMNIELGDLLEIFGLPADLPADTDEETASEMIPLSKIAQASGMDLEDLKQELGFPASVTGDTTWGEAVEAMLPGSKSVDYVYWMDFKSKLQKIKNRMW